MAEVTAVSSNKKSADQPCWSALFLSYNSKGRFLKT
jgi:hypothetical protein